MAATKANVQTRLNAARQKVSAARQKVNARRQKANAVANAQKANVTATADTATVHNAQKQVLKNAAKTLRVKKQIQKTNNSCQIW